MSAAEIILCVIIGALFVFGIFILLWVVFQLCRYEQGLITTGSPPISDGINNYGTARVAFLNEREMRTYPPFPPSYESVLEEDRLNSVSLQS